MSVLDWEGVRAVYMDGEAVWKAVEGPRQNPPLMRCTRKDCGMREVGRVMRLDSKWVLSFSCESCNRSGGFTCKVGALASGVTIRD